MILFSCPFKTGFAIKVRKGIFPVALRISALKQGGEMAEIPQRAQRLKGNGRDLLTRCKLLRFLSLEKMNEEFSGSDFGCSWRLCWNGGRVFVFDYNHLTSEYQIVLAGRYSPNTLRSTPQISPKVA